MPLCKMRDDVEPRFAPPCEPGHDDRWEELVELLALVMRNTILITEAHWETDQYDPSLTTRRNGRRQSGARSQSAPASRNATRTPIGGGKSRGAQYPQA